MPPTNANDPLRTTDHDPSAAPPRSDHPADRAPTLSVVGSDTDAYVPAQNADPLVGVPGCDSPTVVVPGYSIEGLHKAATEWLDRPPDPKEGLGVGFAPNGDPRRNPFEWEAWHECDVFRAHVEGRLAGKP
jgi:hypothetical protein